MNEDILKGKWKQVKGNVKQQWGKLTDDEVDRLDGSQDKLIGLVQERYGYERDQAKKEVNAWLERY
ncbi:MAG TPA: CsbD family protein [Pseudomonadaceae bacterium]|nr:CsbD family protein [Pseudomonadaceae bacterium]